MKNCFNKKTRRTGGLFGDIVVPVILFFVVFFIFWAGVNSISNTNSEKQLGNIQQAISRSAVHCYATEGFYPDNIKYLEDNYGLSIDYTRYNVHYEIFASNLMPQVTVVERQ